MLYPKDRNVHRPLHLTFFDEDIYFITARTYKEELFLFDNQRKKIFKKVFKNLINEYGIKVYAWVILSNHYHLLVEFKKKEETKLFVNRLHSITATLINRLDNKLGRKIWYQYRERIIRNRIDFLKHFNYIHQNPVKHGLVKNIDELPNYKFCSYKTWLDKMGEEWLAESWF